MTEPSTGAAPTSAAPEGTNFDDGFEAGKGVASDEFREQLEDQLLDAGFDPDDIEEVLYDPSPRRKHHRRHKRRSMSYDPAPRKRRKSRRKVRSASAYPGKGRSKGKDMLKKLSKYAFPGAAVGSFLIDYNTRAQVLKTAGATLKDGTAVGDIFTAIMYDFENFNSGDAMTRLQSKVMTYGLPLVGGFAVKQTNIAGSYSGLVGDLLMGYGTGKLAKAVMDPPVRRNPYTASPGCCGGGTAASARQTAQQVRVLPPQNQATSRMRQQVQAQSQSNPYA